MPGMIQLRDDARIVNHAEATRLSLPSRAGSAFGARNPNPIVLRIAKLENIRKITACVEGVITAQRAAVTP